jgi:hypothetical protein
MIITVIYPGFPPAIPSDCFFFLAMVIAFWKREWVSRAGGFYE